jgi:hypothetical protein
MITKPTVLILGAGASMPYGFPSGRQLLKIIDSSLNPNGSGNWANTLRKLNIVEDHFEAFRRELFYSGRSSVDAFLEHRIEFLHIGKLAITLGLIPFEEESRLFDINYRENSWYEYLFAKLNAKFEVFDQNRLSVITFNYDRSLEHYLFKTLKSSYGKSDEECAEKLGKLPIIHVHGRLGALPWQGEGGRPYLNRADVLKPEVIRSISEQITVISEKEDTSPIFDEVFNIMMNAERIYFLGFGYYEVNLRRLKINILKNKQLFGTSYGLGLADIKTINDKWRIIFPIPYLKVLEFLRDYAPLE